MSMNSTDNSCIVINKNYTELFKKNLVLGFQIGEAVVCSEVFSKSDPIHEQPFWNRLGEIGSYNYLQDTFFSHIKPWNSSNIVDNFIYQGLLQGAKWFPNFLVQNHIKELIHISGYTPVPFIKNLIIITPGMITFFTIGANEAKIVDETYKWSFVVTVLAGSAAVFFKNKETSKAADSEVIKLNLAYAGWAGLGLIGSFAGNEIYHRIGLDEGRLFDLDKVDILKLSIIGGTIFLSGGGAVILVASVTSAAFLIDPLVEYAGLNQGDFFGYNKVDILSLSILAVSAAGNLNPDKASLAGGKIAAFALAKPIAVVAVEMAWDNAESTKDYICSFALIESGCKYLGLVEQITEEGS